MRIPIKATARVPINRPDTYQRLPTARPHLRIAAGPYIRYKDYRRSGQARYRTMTLAADEFIRRFLLHVLPKGFHRIRHYGLLASPACKANIARARELIAAPEPLVNPAAEHDNADADGAAADHRPLCPCCGGPMIIVEIFERGGKPRGPPSSSAGIGTGGHDAPYRLVAPCVRRNILVPGAAPRFIPVPASAAMTSRIMQNSGRRLRQQRLIRNHRHRAPLGNTGKLIPRRCRSPAKSP